MKFWVPYGKDNEYINSINNFDKMSLKERDDWLAAQAPVNNADVVATSLHNYRLGCITGAISVLVGYGIGFGITLLARHIHERFAEKKKKQEGF